MACKLRVGIYIENSGMPEFPRDVAKMFFGSLERNFQSDLEIIKSLFKKGWVFTHPLHTVTHSLTSGKIRKRVRISPKTF